MTVLDTSGGTAARPRVLLIGTGAIGAALLPGWVLWFRASSGWDCRVVLTEHAAQLVSTTALAALSGHPVEQHHRSDGSVGHRELAEWADVVVVAPATANTVAKLAVGISDSLALSVVTYTRAPVVIVPSLPGPAAESLVHRRALEQLRADGALVMGLHSGWSAQAAEVEIGGMPNVLEVERFLADHGLPGQRAPRAEHDAC